MAERKPPAGPVADNVIFGPGGGGDGGHLPPRQAGGDPRKDCPLTPLGHAQGRYHVLNAAGEYRIVTARALESRAELAALMGGRVGWVFAHFPKFSDAKREAASEAGEAIMQWCHEAGLWDDRIEVRGPGIWPSDDGAPLLHLGDRVVINGESRAAGFIEGEALYVAHAALRRPAHLPADVAAGRAIIGDLGLWTWRIEGAATLLLGWLATAYLGGAIRWRPNIFLTGGAGTGKTTLFRLLRAALPLHGYTNDSTRAGLVDALNGKPRPTLIDEAEDPDAVPRLVALMRTAAGEDGTRGLRGTPEGGGRSFAVLGSVVMAAVRVPDMPPQDASRFSVLELQGGDGDQSAAMRAAVERARGLGPALWARMLARFDAWRRANEAFRAALIEGGSRPREADHLGALLAGWWVLTEDSEVGPAQAKAGVAGIAAFVQTAADVASDDGPQRCLQHLVTAIVFVGDNRRRALGELVADAFNHDPEVQKQKTAARLDLARLGIGVRDEEGGIVWFGNRAAGVAYLFRDTPWDAGGWRAELLRLPATSASGRSIRIGGRGTYSGHAVGLAARLLLDGDV
jgi:hypothetical protein